MYFWAQTLFVQPDRYTTKEQREEVNDNLKKLERNSILRQIMDIRSEQIRSECRKNKLKKLIEIPMTFANNINYDLIHIKDISSEEYNKITRNINSADTDWDLACTLANALGINPNDIKFSLRGRDTVAEQKKHKACVTISINQHLFSSLNDISPKVLLPTTLARNFDSGQMTNCLNPFQVWTFREEAEKERIGKRVWQVIDRKLSEGTFNK